MESIRRRAALFLIAAGMVLYSFDLPPLLNAQEIAAASPASGGTTPSAQTTQQTEEILKMLGEMRQELKDSRQEVLELRKEVNELRQELESGTHSTADAENLKDAVDQLRDDQAVLQSEVRTLDQSKVGSESKYPLRLTGMVLFNSYAVDGAVDNPILPLIALPRTSLYVHHSQGATLEQTVLGLNAKGPMLWSARTSADVAVDFFNFSYTLPQPSDMNLRLRTVDVNLDWKNRQVSTGLQTPLITPLSPTSFSTVGEPALAWAGNLWTWLPQASFAQHKAIGDSAHADFSFGLLDPTAGDVIDGQAYGIIRRSLQPGYEGRIAYGWENQGRPFEIGASGYYTRQLYYGVAPYENQALDFWAGTADWRVPIAKIGELSGEFYRGRGIGDLGGGAFKDVVTENGAEYASGLNAIGGWGQWKSRLTPSLEVNGFFGMDNAEASQVRDQAPAASLSPYLYLIRNQSTGANIIYRPKTYLVFSGEYRYLRSWYTYGPAREAQSLDLTMGYLF